MKKLLFAISLLFCFLSNAQNSFKLKTGSELTYNVEENGKTYDMVVKIVSLNPFLEFDYKSSDEKYKGNLKFGASSGKLFYTNYFIDGVSLSNTGAAVYLQKPLFDKLVELDKNFHEKGIAEDTTGVRISFDWAAPPVVFGAIGFQMEDITANGTDLALHTYAISEMGADFGEGYIMRVNADSNTPIVTYLNSAKGKFSIVLKKVTGVEPYEYIK